MHGLRDVEDAARLEGGGGKFVPVAQFVSGDIEAIGDGDERVSTTRGVTLCRAGGGNHFNRHDEFIADAHGVLRGDAVGLGNLGGVRVE